MSDSRQAYDEQLPWLEAVDDEDGPGGVPARRMLAALRFVLHTFPVAFRFRFPGIRPRLSFNNCSKEVQ